MTEHSSIPLKALRYLKRKIHLPHRAEGALKRMRHVNLSLASADTVGRVVPVSGEAAAPATVPTARVPMPAGPNAPTMMEIYKGYTDEDIRIFDLFNVTPRPKSGFVTDFLGTRTRTSSLWDAVRSFDGQVLGRPVPHDLFEAIEWIGFLKAVASAKGSFSMMELGAGWGPWLVAGAVASNHRGIKDVHLLGVEADPGRFELMRQHFIDNDIDPELHCLLCAAVGNERGHARWPKIVDPPNAGGARPIRDNGSVNREDANYIPHAVEDYIDVDILPLRDLLAYRPVWDLIHIDVQGWEGELVAGNAESLTERARWLVIGTHSRVLDGSLIDTLHRAGWVLENEKPTRFTFRPNQKSLELMTEVDGAQIWRNPDLCRDNFRTSSL